MTTRSWRSLTCLTVMDWGVCAGRNSICSRQRTLAYASHRLVQFLHAYGQQMFQLLLGDLTPLGLSTCSEDQVEAWSFSFMVQMFGQSPQALRHYLLTLYHTDIASTQIGSKVCPPVHPPHSPHSYKL